ncbi:unnamed protein product [Lactuca saligna]|uniref:Uncharacterized protein n=1 Tax=Lactuca saligna TaxID=75948 RepID=A0AA36E6V3_LACSI|nr:unnamed protein product [Lactuca saligna]
MTEKLEGKGTNAERLAALEGSVNQVIDASEVAHRVEVATQMQSEDDEDEESSESDNNANNDDSKRAKKKKKKRDPLFDCWKLKIPVFSGADVHGWIYKVERYFEVHKFGKKDQLWAVAICLEDAPLTWFRWNVAKNPFRS